MERDQESVGEAEPPAPEPARSAKAIESNPETQARSTVPLPATEARDHLLLAPGGAFEHYEIIRELGHGGMGSVFLARDTRLARLCAIKIMRQRTGEGARRFLAEARATARCRHESIVTIYEVDELRGSPYMVLEYLEGRTLRAFLTERERSEPATPGLAIELVLPVVRALVCAHEMGIVHRDLKPENIFLTEAGQVKVLDFGIAKRIVVDESAGTRAPARNPSASDPGLTRHGALVGTLPYMSPEQRLGMAIGPETDLWAVGLILHELVTGSHPLAPTTMSRLLEVEDLVVPMPSVHERLPDVGPLGAVIDRCLKKHRSERISSARELLAELESLGRKAPAPLDDDNPFAGLAAFQESDTARFFGRERDVAALLSQLRNQPLVAVAGPSGAGKSSVVRAGLIPALKRSDDSWEVFTVRPGRRPLEALAGVLVQAGAGAAPDALAAALRDKPGHLGAALRACCRRHGRHRILLFVDQLEEVYTLGDPGERTAFLTCLEGMADDASSPLRVVLAVRSDFLDRIAADRHFMAEVTRGLVFLSPMGRDGLRDALTRPLDAVSHRYEADDLVEQMLDELQRTPCPLPVLQFTATQLWEARDRDRRLLTCSGYHALGGIAGALSCHADAVLAALSPPEQRLARAILLRLVTPERTRAIADMAELREIAGGGAAEPVVQHLAAARLLVIEPGGERDSEAVQLVHESLVDTWPKLRQWLDEDDQDVRFLARLRAAAEPWEACGKPEGLLWRDRTADEAGLWLERRRAARGTEPSSGLGKREERYLLAVVARAERSRRMRRRAVAAAITALGAIAVVVSYLALRANAQARRADDQAVRADVQAHHANEQAHRADDQAARALAEARRARNAARMAAARELVHDPTTALELLRELEPPDLPRGWAQLARRALQDGVATTVLAHPAGISSAAWSPDGKHILTASADHAVRVWSADGTGQPLVLRGHGDTVTSVAWSPDGTRIASASWDATVRVWSADGTGQPLILRDRGAKITSVAWSPDGRRIVAGTHDQVAVWSADGAGPPLRLNGHAAAVLSVAFSPDGGRIVTASADRTVRVWNADGIGQPLVLEGHDGIVWSAVWSPDGERILSASVDKTARIWRVDGTGRPLVLRGHLGGLTRAVWSPDGRRILTASHDKTARMYHADRISEPLVYRGHEASVSSVAWSPDGTRILTASEDGTARVYGSRDAGSTLAFHGHLGEVYSAMFSPDGTRIVTASDDKTARVWSADGSAQLLVLRGHAMALEWAAWSPDGTRIVTGSDDKTARIWSADGRGEPLVLEGHGAGVHMAAWSPDGTRIVTASGDDKTVRVWAADGRGELLRLQGHQLFVLSAMFSPDGSRIVTAAADKTARVWSIDDRAEPIVLQGHEGVVWFAAFSSDGRRIVTASSDRTARVWSADGRGEPVILHGHQDLVVSAMFSPDGKRIVTASHDKTVRVWSADGTGEPLVLTGAQQPYNRAAWSPDGRRVVAVSDDGTVWVWTDLEALTGVDDPRLWRATTYCLPVGRRTALLNIDEATAQSQHAACVRRVAETHAAGSR